MIETQELGDEIECIIWKRCARFLQQQMVM